MANAPPDFRELPVTVVSPPLADALKHIDRWILCGVLGLLLIFYAPEGLNLVGGILLCIALVLLWRGIFGSDKFEFSDKRVRVTTRLTLKKLVWEESLSAFAGVRLDYTHHEEEPEIYFVKLVHPDIGKTLTLYKCEHRAPRLLANTVDMLAAKRNIPCESAARTFLYKVSDALKLPVLKDED